MDVFSFLWATSKVYHEEVETIKRAKTKPESINYLVGKIMQHTKGECNPELAFQVCKLMLNE